MISIRVWPDNSWMFEDDALRELPEDYSDDFMSVDVPDDFDADMIDEHIERIMP